MSQDHIETTVVHQPLEDRWAAWQARGVANRATRRNLFIVASIVMLVTIILNVGGWSADVLSRRFTAVKTTFSAHQTVRYAYDRRWLS